RGAHVRADPELALDGRGLGAVAHDVRIGALADQEVDRLDEQRFAGAGLAGDDVEARAELEVGAFDQGQVAEREAFEHGSSRGGREATATDSEAVDLIRPAGGAAN